MRRKRSNELPRFAQEQATESRSFRWRRRYVYYLLTFAAVCWYLYPWCKNDNALNTNWSNYAYSLYATDTATLCHAVLLFDALARFGSRADRVLFYPEYWDTRVDDAKDRDSQLLVMARDTYKVKLHPMVPLRVEGRIEDTWTGVLDKSVTKFMAFSLEYYDRVISLDSDTTLLQSLDELFLLPPAPIAMPRAYAAEKPWPLTSMLMVIKPSLIEFEKLKKRLSVGGDAELVQAQRIDVELVNERFEDSALILPHRPYALLTGEFRRDKHSAYLGNADETWDAEKVYSEAKLVYFSDAPLPKPWVQFPRDSLEEIQPDCGGSHEGTCAERRIWKHLYDDFRHRRRDVCKLLSVPAPAWGSIKMQPLNSTEGSGDAAPQASGSSSAASSV